MAFPDTHRPQPAVNTGSEQEPPGATTSAADNRTQNPRQAGRITRSATRTRTRSEPSTTRSRRAAAEACSIPHHPGRRPDGGPNGTRRQGQVLGEAERKAEHIEEGYEPRGVWDGEAERRAWATVNKESGGGTSPAAAGEEKDTNVSSRRAARRAGRRRRPGPRGAVVGQEGGPHSARRGT